MHFKALGSLLASKNPDENEEVGSTSYTLYHRRRGKDMQSDGDDKLKDTKMLGTITNNYGNSVTNKRGR
jgi:hypothetical protein